VGPRGAVAGEVITLSSDEDEHRAGAIVGNDCGVWTVTGITCTVVFRKAGMSGLDQSLD
jgi:hypothetical protein